MSAPTVGPPEPGEASGTKVPTHEFRIVSRGYDPEQVQTYIDHVLAEITRLSGDNWELRRRLRATERDAPDRVLADLRDELERALDRFEQLATNGPQAGPPTSADEPRTG